MKACICEAFLQENLGEHAAPKSPLVTVSLNILHAEPCIVDRGAKPWVGEHSVRTRLLKESWSLRVVIVNRTGVSYHTCS